MLLILITLTIMGFKLFLNGCILVLHIKIFFYFFVTKCKVLCISLFFLEKKSEICNAFTLFEKWKVNFVFLSLFSRMKSEMKMHWDRDREWKVKWKWLEIEKWNSKKKSREFLRNETLAGYCGVDSPYQNWLYFTLNILNHSQCPFTRFKTCGIIYESSCHWPAY